MAELGELFASFTPSMPTFDAKYSIVENWFKLANTNKPIALIRFITAILWFYFLFEALYHGFNKFNVHTLRYTLTCHHTLATFGLDEGIGLNALSKQSLLRRMITPFAKVTPLFSFLPMINYIFLLVITFYGYALHLVLSQSTDDDSLTLYLYMYGIICIFDVGFFFSTRPGDILKFLIATLLVKNGNGSSIYLCYFMVACLYMWSGISKLRGYFSQFVFQYWFCLMSPVSYHIKSLYLNENGWPTKFGIWFGWFGALQEAIVGICMLIPSTMVPYATEIQYGAVCLGTLMHVFIFIFGIGPYRWNIMQVYLLWASYIISCERYSNNNNYNTNGGVGNFFTTELLKDNNVDGVNNNGIVVFVYGIVFGMIIPIIGLFSTKLLGKYLGGYRMGNFHFAGNEFATLFLLDNKNVKNEMIKDINEYEQYIKFSFGADTMDIRPCIKEYKKTHTPLMLRDEMLNNIMLNTKFDESLEIITLRYAGIIREKYTNNGKLLMFQAFPINFFHGTTKEYEIWDLSDGIDHRRLIKTGHVDLPWERYDQINGGIVR